MLTTLRFTVILFFHAVTLYLMHKPKYGAARSAAALGGLFLVLAVANLALMTSGLGAAVRIIFFCSMIAYCAVYLLIAEGGLWRNLFVFATTPISLISRRFFPLHRGRTV